VLHVIGATASRRYQRGALRREGNVWTVRWRAEAAAIGELRPQRKLVVGKVGELRTRQAARVEADRRLELLGVVARIPGRRVRFDDFLGAYLTSRVAILKQSSAQAFRSYSQHLTRELGRCWLDEIDVGVAQHLIAALAARGLSRSTVYAIAALLRRMLKAARAQGIAAAVIGPADLVLPKESRVAELPRCFTIEETQRILAASKFPWLALWSVLAYTGLRAGEALGLAWESIDFEASQVRVRQQSAHGRLATLKSRNSTTAIPLPAPLVTVLKAYREVWKPNARGLLFANAKGGPLWSHGVLRNHLKPILREIGIPHEGAGMHAWRHALATEASRAGVATPAVKALLRHSSLAITLRYSHTSFDDVRKGSEQIAQLIARPIASAPRCGSVETPKPAIQGDSGGSGLNSISESTDGAEIP
jgi:integrase